MRDTLANLNVESVITTPEDAAALHDVACAFIQVIAYSDDLPLKSVVPGGSLSLDAKTRLSLNLVDYLSRMAYDASNLERKLR